MSSPDMEKTSLLSNPSPLEQEDQQEPSLSQLQANIRSAQRAYFQAWSRTTSGKWHRRIMITVTAFLLLFVVFSVTVIVEDEIDRDDDGGWGDGWGEKVPLEAHIMSKCPDARDCLRDLILPAMQKVSSRVSFQLSFIGNATDHDDGVSCMHGSDECLGNIIELCAAKEYPDPKIYLGFTMCLSREYARIPERALVEACALEHGIDMEVLNRCTVDEDGALAVHALQESFKRTKEAGVTRSCTVRLDGEIRCVRDGGEWKDCPSGSSVKDLIRDIKKLSS